MYPCGLSLMLISNGQRDCREKIMTENLYTQLRKQPDRAFSQSFLCQDLPKHRSQPTAKQPVCSMILAVSC